MSMMGELERVGDEVETAPAGSGRPPPRLTREMSDCNAALAARFTALAKVVTRLALAKLTAQERLDGAVIIGAAYLLFGGSVWTLAELEARAAGLHVSDEFDEVMTRNRDKAGGLRPLGWLLAKLEGVPMSGLQLDIGDGDRDGRMYAISIAGF